jgi:hypothetical protein
LSLSQPEAWATAVFVDEIDAGQLKGPLKYGEGRMARFRSSTLK